MTKLRDDFAMFILSHKRAKRVDTLKLLERKNFNGRWYILIDNLDPEQDLYKELYGDHVIVFDKAEEIRTRKTDIMLNAPKENVVVWARNKVFEIARDMGLKFFAEFDDDYTSAEFRIYDYYAQRYKLIPITDINEPIAWTLELLETAKIPVVAWAQGGDFMGGDSNYKVLETLKRKVMNTFFWNMDYVDENMKFLGFLNEDVNFYVWQGMLGKVMFTIPFICINQRLTQTNAGGLTEAYLSVGTYVKSVLTSLISPSGVQVRLMGYTNPRLHHAVYYKRIVPMILSDKYKKR